MSGWHCEKLNDWYYQCLPGGATSTTPSPTQAPPPPPPPPTTGTGSPTSVPSPSATGTGPGTTLRPNYYWIRAVVAPNFHKYLQSSTLRMKTNSFKHSVISEHHCWFAWKKKARFLMQSSTAQQRLDSLTSWMVNSYSWLTPAVRFSMHVLLWGQIPPWTGSWSLGAQHLILTGHLVFKVRYGQRAHYSSSGSRRAACPSPWLTKKVTP